MKNRMLGALSAAAAAAFLCLSAWAEIAEEPLLNPNDPTDVWGKKITGLGDNGDETALVFTKTGATMSWTLPDGVKSIWYLVVGGGGSGGTSYADSVGGGGGGGAGGMLEKQDVLITSRDISVSVGKGGDAVVGTSNNGASRPAGNAGDNSSLTIDGVAITAHGGGGGGGCGSTAGKKGGSGGGAYRFNTAGGCYAEEGNPGGRGTLTSGNNGGGGGGGAGGEGGSTSGASGGKGGPGKISLIGGGYVALVKDDSGNDYYCAGGGGGGAGTSSGGVGGIGGGGRGNVYNGSAATTSDSGSNYGCGGGGTQGNQWKTHTSGAGYQGVVVVRYRVLAANEIPVPTISGKTYNGELQKADIADGEGYYVAANEGGVDAGDYVVTVTPSNGYQWVGGSRSSLNLTFTIAKAANGWTTQPTLSKTTWELDDDPATVNAGAALSETDVVITYDDDATEMPLTIGTHKAVFTVEESQNYLGFSKTISYTISKNTNAWTVEPSMTKTTWAFDEEPGEIVAGAAKYGEITVTYDGKSEIEELPATLGSHDVKFAVAAGETFTELSKTVKYTVTKKINSWTTPPQIPTSFNIEDPVPTFVPPEAAHGTVTTYYDNNPSITELPTTLGAHTVTYSVAEDDDYDKFAKTYTFQVTYKPIVDQSDPSKVYGYRIPKLGANHDEVALVFTNTGYTADNPMSYALPQAVTEIDYLVVGGGGGGGGWTGSYAAGGGGAGGVVSNKNVAVSGALSIVVGKGGAGCTSKPYNTKSGDSSLLVIEDAQPVTAYGGGKGGCAAAGTGGEGFGAGGGGGSTSSGGQYVGFAGGAAGQGFAGGKGGNTTYRGGGGGGAGEPGQTPTSTNSGKGGDGVASDITGQETWYAGGGGAGSQTNNGGIASPGGKGGGGAGGACASNQQMAGRNATYFGGGGGSAKGDANGGSGYQGVVIVRYVEPKGVVMVPYIAPKTYTSEALVADVPANVGYTVTENAGGTDVGEYAVILTLNAGYHWDGGSTEPANLVFAITPAQNEWTVEPSITKATWLTTDDPGELTPGETKFGSPTATITKGGGDAESFDGTLPTAAGQYVITYAVETSDNWIDPEVTEKSVAFEIVSGDVVPPFTVTKGAMTTVVGDGKVDLSVGYAVHCEVESDKTVDIYAYYAEDGADTTNEVKIAEGVALDAVGTGVIADLEPGVTYWVALGGKGGDTVAPTTEFTAVTVAGPAIGLTAAATFTNDPKEFVITGSVTPGIGTTTVYLRWSLNSDALDQSQTFAFAFGDTGAFEQKVVYENATDTLTWDVAVSNCFTSTTYGDLTWDDALPASTKGRADSVATIYTWTGAGENNEWANPENWSADKAESFGYPDNETYAKAKITRTVTINLGGKTFKVVKGEALILDANSGDVVTLTNGTLRAEYDGDGDFGAPGTTVVFRDATLNRMRLNPTTKGGMEVVFEGNSRLTGMVRPWNAANAKIIFRNGDISIGGNFGNGGAKSGTEIIISNATVTVQGQATGSWGPGTFPVKLQNGPDRQARIVHTESHGFDFVQSPYTLAIPEQAYATPYLQALKPLKVIETSPVFNIDVTNWKRGKRVPILTFTQSASGVAEQYGNATLRAYENGVDVTEERHARLEWNATKRTLYYKQDGQFGFAVIVK